MLTDVESRIPLDSLVGHIEINEDIENSDDQIRKLSEIRKISSEKIAENQEYVKN